ncbi:MAG: hypothetical protein IJN54_04530 [Lachnospiraceae bacterium]|nr:hypothetical protein [Lachnospiraceae bacterium]
MKMKLMDVTLRESIYLPNNKITIEAAQNLVRGLSEAGVDYIEIGYISKESSKILQEYSPEHYIEAMEEAVVPDSKCSLVVMLHPHLYSDKVLERLMKSKIGMIRLCVPYAKLESSLPIIKKLKEINIAVATNLVRASCLSSDDILKFARTVQEAGSDYVYLADSNGSMLPENVSELYHMLSQKTDMELGFHPHNNLELASANAIEALNSGARIIDSSIYGYGKGMVNLCTESFVAILQQLNKCQHVDFEKIILTTKRAYQDFLVAVSTDIFDIKANSLVSGYKNINLDNQKELAKLAKEKNIPLFDLLLKVRRGGNLESVTI